MSDDSPQGGAGRVVNGRAANSRAANGRAANGRGTEVSDLAKRIIEHLQEDGRRPYTQIAADLGVSEAAVRARTNRLIERGILQVVGVTDPLKLGFQQWAMIGVRCEASRLIEQGALAVDGERVTGRTAYIPARAGDVLVLKRGKRQFARVTLLGG